MGDDVIVGVTDSSAARRALQWAAERAKARDERVILLSVVGGATGVIGEGEVVEEALARTRVLLDREADRVRALGVQCASTIARGDPVDQLIDASRGGGLMVIGSDYRGPGSAMTRGPHGIRVAAGAHCPVIVVPDFDLGVRSGVVVGVDGSEMSEAAVRFAAAEAARAGEVLTAISAWSPVALPLHMRSYPHDYLQNMQALTEETLSIALAGLSSDYPDLEVRRVVESADPASAIHHHAARAALAVVGSRGRGVVARLLLGSTSQAVLSHLSTATAVVR